MPPRRPARASLLAVKEAKWQDTVMRSARLCRWTAYHTYDSRRSAAGFPDCVLLRDGRMIVAELKTETGRLTDDQKHWLREFEAAGAEVYVWRPSNWRQVEAALK